MIQDMIKEKKLNIRKLSQLTGMPYTTVYEYVTGKRDYHQMSVGTFQIIAEKLEIPMDVLWEEWDKETQTDISGNYVLEPGTKVLYRLYKRKNDYIMYVRVNENWIRYQKNYPPSLPEAFYPDYYNMTANKIYYDELLKEHRKQLS